MKQMEETGKLSNENFDHLLHKQLNDRSSRLKEREQELEDKGEELAAQKEELTAAIEELMGKNESLVDTLHQLRERSFELDQILYRTSHDLRAPLSSIRGILSLLKLEPKSEIINTYGRHIEDKVTQMDDLLKSLASLSKSILEEPEITEVDLNKIIWQVIGEFKHLPNWDNMEVQVELRESKIKTDYRLITIIFQSLFSNAFIFREPLKKGKLMIRGYQQNGDWVIEVADDGEGIAMNVQSSVFDMFYRGSERSQGNGLGLYVARKAAGRLQGEITFTLTTGHTCFIVRFPVMS